MKTRNLLFFCFLLPFNLLGQQKSYELSAPDNVSKTYIARDYIRLLPGYSFHVAGGKTLYLGIDEHLLMPASCQNWWQIPDPNRSINTGYAVGSIAGDASVSPTGAAVYQIPIEVMPGTGGLQPNISVAYNSQSGNGLVGYGWSLNAVSAILRTGKTIHHDGSAGVPDLTTSDNLMLDGHRLMRASGTNLNASSTYRTEIESYLDITCKTFNFYLGFEVKNREGWTMEYGSSADSYIRPAGSTAAYAWLLKKVTDANGNYMTYTYDNDTSTGEFRIKQIEYTGNTDAGLSPCNKIEFFYEIRTDQSTAYIAGKSVKQSLILKRIKCSAYNTAIRDYRFNYYYDGYVSKLTEVEEYGMNGMRYNSTVVDWGDYEGSYAKYEDEYFTVFSPAREGISPLYADFNGDGKTDFISYPKKDTYTSSDTAVLYLAYNYYGSVQFFKQCTIPLIAGFVGLLPADLDGDGLMDIVRIHKVNNTTYRYNYYIFNGTSFSASGYYFTSSSPEAFVGDFNGDGKYEILTKSESKLYNQYGSVIATGGITWGIENHDGSYERHSGSSNTTIQGYNKVIDFNGNGKTNLLAVDSFGHRIYELNGSAFSLISSGTNLGSITRGYFGDFNGDGKTDILVYESSPLNEDYILFSNGNGFEKKVLPDLNIRGHRGSVLWFIGDFNQDGKADVAIVGNINHGSINTFIQIGLFNGESFLFEEHESIFMTSSIATDRITFSDFDGDGFPEMCFAGWSNACIIKSFNSKQNLFVQSVTNGLNQQVSFTYHPVTDNGYSGASSLSTVFPVCKFQQPLYVVSSMSRQLGSMYDSEYFYYKGAKVHKQGKGFLGFEEIRVTNYQQNRKTTTQYGYHSNYFNVYPIKQTVTTTGGDSISRTDFQNTYFTTSVSKVIFPYLSSQTTVDKLTGITRKIDYTYMSSDHGNPNKITETQGSLITETMYTWEAKGSSAYKNRVTQQTTTRKGIGAQFVETKKFEYDTKARLTQQIDYYGHPKAVTGTYSNYDPFGNPLTVTTTAANCPAVTESFVYDTTGRFITSHTDALGNSSYAQYDPKTGVLQEKTNAAGLKTTYYYDGFQRVIQAVSPVDRLSYSVAWDISGNNLFKTTVNSLVSGDQTSWYNAAGQETKTQSQGFSGTVILEKTYNSKGQLYRSYLPGYGASSSQYIEYAYDNFGRIVSENNIGRVTTYGYSGLTANVTTPDGKTTSSTLNTSGLLAASTDATGNAVTYTYNSLGKPATATANGLTSHITYDDRGFQRALKDVNLTDSVRYEYDAYGRLIAQTNARGQITACQYDVAGRITVKSSPEDTLTYQYVPSGNGIGQIQYIKNAGRTVRTYAYTSLGQPSSVIERIDNTNYVNSYVYNANGQMTQRTTPSGLQISYQYTNGTLTSMHNAENNALLWQANAVNALGQITESMLGNGLTRLTAYDSYHLPNQIALKDGSTFIDRVDYSFSAATGNLTQRNDVTNSRNETFGYDNLHRLTSVALNGGTGNSTSYYPNGNIYAKFDVGTYQYANNNHAVSGIADPVSSYNPPDRSITHTSSNRSASLIQQGSVVKKLTFHYNPDNQRNKTHYYENNAHRKTMHYVGDYEKEFIQDENNGGFGGGPDDSGDSDNTGEEGPDEGSGGGAEDFDCIRASEQPAMMDTPAADEDEDGDGLGDGISVNEYDYIYTPEGLSAIAVKTNGVRSLYYVQTDHLGSIRVVTNASKAVQTRYYYDAWGKQTVLAGTSITNRGYTGQEHLNDFELINLNARLYDPVLGRFLEMDPYVQMPDYTQSFNRYSYALNNPLLYTDPDGEFPWLLAGFVLAKWYYDGYKANNKEFNPLKWTQTPNFVIGYSSQGNSFYLGSGWNNNFSLGFGYSFGSNAPVGGYIQNGELHFGSFAPKPAFKDMYPNGVIRPYEPNGWEMFRDASIFSRLAYDIFDMFWVYGTGALGGYEGAYHLSGAGADRTEFENAGAGVLMSFMPLGAVGGSVAKTGTYSVYRGLDAAGKTRYVGITGRDPAVRFAEHAASGTAKAGLTYQPVATGLTQTQARVWEQNLINSLGLQKNGGQLFNQINSIAPKYWWQYGIYP